MQKKEVTYNQEKITRNIHSILFVTGIIYTGFFIFLQNSVLAIGGLVTIFFIYLGKILIQKRRFSEGNILMLVTANLSVFYHAVVLGKEAGIDLFFFSLVGISLIVFDLSRRLYYLGLFAFSIFLWLFYNLYSFPNTFRIILAPSFYQPIYIWTGIISFIIIFSSLFLFIYYLNFFRQENEKKNSLLVEKNKELEKTLQELQQSKNDNEILAQQTAHSRLVRGIAHEIKNPIGAMFTRADFVREDPETTPAVMKFCNIVMEACDRLSRLTEAMLRYGGNSTVNQTTFDAKEMVENVMIISTGFKEKNIALSADLDEGLTIYGNADFIHSVVQNLLANALQYTDEGAVSVSAKAATYVDSNGTEREGVCIRVVDTGAGIPEDQIDKIFDPYFTSKNSSTNMGLGLSFVYKTVVESGGRVEVRSVVGEGSDFGVYLPGVGDT